MGLDHEQLVVVVQCVAYAVTVVITASSAMLLASDKYWWTS